MSNKLDTKSTTTITRAGLNDRYAKHDLEEWIFSQVNLFDGMRILDIGCGGGKQLLRLAGALSADSQLLGIDVSEGAVDSVRKLITDRPNIQARQMNFEDCLVNFSGQKFDLILSTYAIYYAKDMVALIRGLRELLSENGCIFVSGPGAGTNKEIIELVNALATCDEDRIDPIEHFISDDEINRIRPTYGSVETLMLNNYIAFPDVETVMLWWRSHNSYREALDEGVQAGIRKIIDRDGAFRLSKPVLGVRLNA